VGLCQPDKARRGKEPLFWFKGEDGIGVGLIQPEIGQFLGKLCYLWGGIDLPTMFLEN
jgi:hypothetical protein